MSKQAQVGDMNTIGSKIPVQVYCHHPSNTDYKLTTFSQKYKYGEHIGHSDICVFLNF